MSQLIEPPSGLITYQINNPAHLSTVAVQAHDDEHLVAMWLHNRPATTTKAYRADSDAFRRWTNKPLPMVTVGDLQGYYDSLASQGAASQSRRLAVAKSLLGFAHRLGYIAFNPGLVVKAPKLRNDLAARIVDQAEVMRMVTMEANPRNHFFLHLLYQTGLRLSEALALRWADAKRRDAPAGATGKATKGRAKIAGQLTIVGKGGKTRFVTVGPNLWRGLNTLRGSAGPEDFIFRTQAGGGLHASQAHSIVKAAAARAGLPEAFSAHWCRHAHVSHALDAGAKPHLVQAMVGHSSLATTSRYTHARPDEGTSSYLPD